MNTYTIAYAAPHWRTVAECMADARADSPWPISGDATVRAAAARARQEHAPIACRRCGDVYGPWDATWTCERCLEQNGRAAA